MLGSERAVPAASSVMPGLDAGNGMPGLSVAVGIATTGRPAVLGETLRRLTQQTQLPAMIVVLYGTAGDIEELPGSFPEVLFLAGTGGLCDKRNRILEVAAPCDLILFLDDDFLLDASYLQVLAAAFGSDTGLAAATGTLLADGINGPGLTMDEAAQIFTDAPAENSAPAHKDVFNTYGCNMAFRMRLIREHSLRFDVQLPFYAWYEDIDFSRRIGAYGATRRLRDARGIHMGTKAGRISGRRLGYSQVANPIYLWRKGTFPGSHMIWSVGRNVLANLLRLSRPEPYVDRRGRARGNLLAFRDLLRGRVHPTRILDLH